jgi:trk system potassium uptake protein TrkH
MEWHNTLSPLSVPDRILSGFFQAVNARTSGFNTLPLGSMANETLFILILLMFIGASPGSCGGGIKTTTFSTLVAFGISRFRGHERPQLFNRSISERSIQKAVSVVLISTLVVCVGIMILLETELGGIPHPQSRGKFLELFFEVVSAFGTVGLSTGITDRLSTIGKIIITGIMFIGRLGPLLVAVAVSRPIKARYFYAEENIMIG